ncbi:hypothetical protein POM88_002957 [Heracleum sosnowskyi]|uniref:RNase H type-1 domain-containing protein n=1 Tax=Heracleum sosnowskyi TaxID=360622 RepID=A0AAD8NBU9_9APIA|nr:hypothetical protein POM88_002957 [Heracleum sosnowskyi]
MLFEYQQTRPIWFSCPLAFNPPSESTYSVIQWLLSLISKLDIRRDHIHLLSNFTFVARSIWLARNKFVFDNVPSLLAMLTILHCSGIPPVNLVKFNCDGAFKRGVRLSALLAETLMESFWMQQLSNVIIESDCKLPINLCSGEAALPWDSIVLIEDIKSMTSEFSINLSFVPRCYNVAAHWVAKQALLKFMSLNWVFDPPIRLSSVLRSDLGV